MADLTEKRQRFVEAMCGEAVGNAAEAARLAGYQARNAHGFAVIGNELLTKPDIRQAIAAFQEKTRTDAIATAQAVAEFLTEAMRNPAGVEPSRIQAAKELARIRGYLPPKETKVEHTGAEVVLYLPDNGRGR